MSEQQELSPEKQQELALKQAEELKKQQEEYLNNLPNYPINENLLNVLKQYLSEKPWHQVQHVMADLVGPEVPAKVINSVMYILQQEQAVRLMQGLNNNVMQHNQFLQQQAAAVAEVQKKTELDHNAEQEAVVEPQTAPEAVAETVPEAVAETVPEPTAEVTPETDAKVEVVSEAAVEVKAEAAPDTEAETKVN